MELTARASTNDQTLRPRTGRTWRPRLRYSLTSLFVLMTLVILLWQVLVAGPYNRERRALAVIERSGWMVDGSATEGPAWARRLLGDEYFVRAVRIRVRGQPNPAAIAALNDLTGLGNLELEHVGVTDATFLGLARLHRLAALRVHGTRLTDRSLSRLHEFFPNLQVLVLYDVAVTDASLVHLGKLPKLRVLALSHVRVGDRTMASLTRLRNLELIKLGPTQVTDGAIESFARMPSLKTLDLGGAVSRRGVEKLKRALPRCYVFAGED